MSFIDTLPKAELHVHLEGTLEPEQMFQLAARNGVGLPWDSAEALRAEFTFTGLEHFLRLYTEGCRVLCTRQDFYDLAAAYLRRSAAEGVLRAEVFFAPQNFLDRDIPVTEQFGGVLDAIDDARADTGIDGAMLVIAQRHRTEAAALELLEAVRPFRDRILGVGLGSAERGNPPSKFARFFTAARAEGYRLTCHAGEEGPPSYIREALDVCGVERIDHGYAATQDPDLVTRLADDGVPLTMCPLSNLRLQVTSDLSTYPLADLMKAGVLVTVNSDDPPYFGGYVNDNYAALERHLGLGNAELAALARNSFAGSFGDRSAVDRGLTAVDDHEPPAEVTAGAGWR
ncbi:adenosine deaminase [Pseudonocardia kujensis]|uniref:adenosine deaminase n=1 Tax=Pseudonocardia kujensis TaxID=1128675 RepID=UPI001E506EDE|nr:adenosine deaminase [Pseudonocardia kujensis]MCE0765036.1 adenosine deaminase [Pseudonocardia kujensis]